MKHTPNSAPAMSMPTSRTRGCLSSAKNCNPSVKIASASATVAMRSTDHISGLATTTAAIPAKSTKCANDDKIDGACNASITPLRQAPGICVPTSSASNCAPKSHQERRCDIRKALIGVKVKGKKRKSALTVTAKLNYTGTPPALHSKSSPFLMTIQHLKTLCSSAR